MENNDGLEYFYPADSIVYALGMNPDTAVVEALCAAVGDIPFRAVGDCARAADVAKAIRAAYVAAVQIA